jgi:hypothetical protein
MAIERNEFDITVRGMLRAVAVTKIHTEALSRAFLAADPVANTVRLNAHLRTVQREWEPALAQLDEGTPQSLAAFLQKFEGTVQ